MTGGTPAFRARRRSSARVLCALAGAAAVAAIAPGAAEAKLQFGIQAVRQTPEILSPAEVHRMRQGGADTVRTLFEWRLAQFDSPNQPLDFSRFDEFMTAASDGSLPKIEVIPVLFSSPPWVKGAENADARPPTAPGDVDRWRNFVTQIFRRYGSNGTFWSQHPELQFNPLRVGQVWNEPNLRTFWADNDPDPREYAKFLKLTDKAIRAGDPQAETILAGMPERSNAPQPMRTYLKKLYKVKNIDKFFDAVAVHPFAEDERGVKGALERIREVVDDNKDKKKPLWVTEVGFASQGPNSPFTVSAGKQAKLLRKVFKTIKKNRKKFDVEQAIWFSWRDLDSDPPKDRANFRWQSYTGLFTKQGQPKPAWNAFTDFVGGNAGSGNIP